MTLADQIDEAISEYGVEFIAKQDSKLMIVISYLLFWLHLRFMNYYWTTIRFPFCRVWCFYPTTVKDPLNERHEGIVGHEILFHAKDFHPWYGPWVWIPLYLVVPLPAIFSGRWFFERYAKLYDIKRLITIRGWDPNVATTKIVNGLWGNYGWCWPRPLMRRFFKAQLSANAS